MTIWQLTTTFGEIKPFKCIKSKALEPIPKRKTCQCFNFNWLILFSAKDELDPSHHALGKSLRNTTDM